MEGCEVECSRRRVSCEARPSGYALKCPGIGAGEPTEELEEEEAVATLADEEGEGKRGAA